MDSSAPRISLSDAPCAMVRNSTARRAKWSRSRGSGIRCLTNELIDVAPCQNRFRFFQAMEQVLALRPILHSSQFFPVSINVRFDDPVVHDTSLLCRPHDY
jgi:hypothetical protein